MTEPTVAAPEAQPTSLQRTTRRVVLVMLAAVAVYFVFAVHSGFRELGGRLAGFAWWTFFAALALAFGNYVLRFFKWQYYLRVLDIRGVKAGDSFLTFLSGFVLSVTPGKVGEVFKSLVLWQTYGIAGARTAPIVVAERLTDLIGVIALIAVGSTRFSGGLVWAGAGTVLVGFILVVVASRRLSMWFVDLVAWMPGPGKRLAPKLREAYESLYALTRPSTLVLPTILSIAAWFLECLALWIILQGFAQTTSVLASSFFYATSTLAGALIPVPGGLGVTETVMRTLMRQLGNVDKAGATGAMLLVRFATLWFAVIVGFVALSLLRRRHPKLLRD
ncbi:MAG: flippase-like domain-containing protein [Deltaproteobacteria bacterium]|nr:flippase-like domain-containing protein [Deltaproteobacteria bacterium]